MSSRHKFVIDTNIFIEAYKRYYSFDIAPSFGMPCFNMPKTATS